ncbi:hypothetical protein AB1Y20_018004 [Prymnesium parvum]|uniref:Uncharacterized protein n=1 Tax=Prymnesium parvum TaxID=97485 RepID=A0AB34JQQ3_PRYPA
MVPCAPFSAQDDNVEGCYSWCMPNAAANCPRCKCRACAACQGQKTQVSTPGAPALSASPPPPFLPEHHGPPPATPSPSPRPPLTAPPPAALVQPPKPSPNPAVHPPSAAVTPPPFKALLPPPLPPCVMPPPPPPPPPYITPVSTLTLLAGAMKASSDAAQPFLVPLLVLSPILSAIATFIIIRCCSHGKSSGYDNDGFSVLHRTSQLPKFHLPLSHVLGQIDRPGMIVEEEEEEEEEEDALSSILPDDSASNLQTSEWKTRWRSKQQAAKGLGRRKKRCEIGPDDSASQSGSRAWQSRWGSKAGAQGLPMAEIAEDEVPLSREGDGEDWDSDEFSNAQKCGSTRGHGDAREAGNVVRTSCQGGGSSIDAHASRQVAEDGMGTIESALERALMKSATMDAGKDRFQL